MYSETSLIRDGMKKFGRIREVVGIHRFIPIFRCFLGPNSIAGLDSVGDVQRLGLERFHCTVYCIHFIVN